MYPRIERSVPTVEIASDTFQQLVRSSIPSQRKEGVKQRHELPYCAIFGRGIILKSGVLVSGQLAARFCCIVLLLPCDSRLHGCNRVTKARIANTLGACRKSNLRYSARFLIFGGGLQQ